MDTYVIVDLETTGHSVKSGDELIEFAAVVVQEGEVIERYSTLIRPSRPIPPFITQLTTISDEDVSDAPTFEDVIPDIWKMLDGRVFVAHNVAFDLTFLNESLEQAGYLAFQGRAIDTVELARILYPTLESHALEALSDTFDLVHTDAHRALSDAEATAELFIRMFDRLRDLPMVTLKRLRELSESWTSHIEPLLDEMILEVGIRPDDETRFDIHRKIALRRPVDAFVPTTEREPFEPFLLRTIEETLPSLFEQFEPRQSQFEMMRHVYKALDDEETLLVEAGTGTGKTLAYLIPSAHHALETKRPVVISTHTIQLQEQLLNRDLPVLRQIFPEIEFTLLKGRRNYIDLRKFEMVLDESNDGLLASMCKAMVLVWLTETETGDLEELSFPGSATQGPASFKRLIQADASNDFGRFDPWYSRDFFTKAVLRSKEADLIVTNHALLFSDLQHQAGILPTDTPLVLDEAHQVEEVASHHFGVTFDAIQFDRLFKWFGYGADGKFHSRIIQLADLTSVTEEAEAFSQQIDSALARVEEELEDLLTSLQSLGKKKEPRQTVRFEREGATFRPIREVANRLEDKLRTLRTSLRHLHRLLDERKEHMTFKQRALLGDLKTLIGDVRELESVIYETMLTRDDDAVSWVELNLGNRKLTSVYTQPVEIGPLLHERLFKKRPTILTSATMTVSGKFSFMERRLGLEGEPVRRVVLPSPFNFKEQAKLFVPSDFPLINEVPLPQFVDQTAQSIVQIANVTKGRMLVLFTSNELLRLTYEQVKDHLDPSYTLLAQGVSGGSRSRLTKQFKRMEQSILFGTASFWEGVDIPGDALTCLVIVRLPFAPPDQPIMQARSEKIEAMGKSPFFELSLPQAVIRFKQGVGRLIRSKGDYGAVFVFDRRVETTRYGKQFINSLPKVDRIEGTLETSLSELELFLDEKEKSVARNDR
ncbi:ATP-dependent DNA helicase DinG [Exiguobacterium sp. BG5(2022)]|uniref:ATP-dependent DNA helicase DinG n=1 Tax=Exiguobacterium sp. BG5(2022) TaxID=2962595 RepID=UPI0028816BED|nr:ATP-dependent DNA helicase DinG [Exiguobacterium sp. BG5(2022)]MDT0191385.1 ATP-dependent DNA helicase DinG [Exiguobacterium sp. BG5(2022)]